MNDTGPNAILGMFAVAGLLVAFMFIFSPEVYEYWKAFLVESNENLNILLDSIMRGIPSINELWGKSA